MTKLSFKKQTANTIEVVAHIAGTEFRTVIMKHQYDDLMNKIYHEVMKD